jgi:hypothetical protein
MRKNFQKNSLIPILCPILEKHSMIDKKRRYKITSCLLYVFREITPKLINHHVNRIFLNSSGNDYF